jgi:hypothetical protein
MKQEQAVDLGRQALIWLAGHPEALEAFMAASGAGPADFRARAADPEFLGFVLDWLLQSDALLLDFAGDAGVAPERAAQARAALPGGAAPHWT